MIEVPTDGAIIAADTVGDGPPLLLLHGFPQTRYMWRPVRDALAAEHTVVTADLRGYGDSSRPATEPGTDHAEHSFRAMAADQVEVMRSLGHERFTVIGHDRGGRVAHRMALDHPDAVERLAVLDIVPTRHVLATVDRVVASAYYHWFFLTQPEPLPEEMIGADPVRFLCRTLGGSLAAQPGTFTEAAMAEYERCIAVPGTVHSMCEDYRAAASIDQTHDEADAGRRVAQPLLACWGTRGLVGRHYDVGAVWAGYADDVSTASVDAGHFLLEEAPDATLAILRNWLSAP